MVRKSPSDGSEETWSPEAASYCGQIWILQAERAGEESRQGAERNRLQRKRPVPQRNPGATQKFCSQSDAVSYKRAPELSSQWTGSTWTGSSTATSVPLRGYINTTPDKNLLYFSFFFSSLSSLVLPFISNYLCHFANLIQYHNKHDTVSLRSI